MIGKNNLLNIRTSTAFNWVGQTGSTRGFADFNSIFSCRRAGLYLLRRSYRRAGCKTVESIIKRWAPVTENDTSNYIMFVCKTTGFHPTDVMVFDSDFAALLAAMEIMENGYIGLRRKTHFEKARKSYLELCDTFKIKNYED